MEPLMTIPASAMIRSSIDPCEHQHALICDLTHMLLKELKRGEKSHFAPDVKYLLGQDRGQIPVTWTEPANELLREIESPSSADNEQLELTDWVEM